MYFLCSFFIYFSSSSNGTTICARSFRRPPNFLGDIGIPNQDLLDLCWPAIACPRPKIKILQCTRFKQQFCVSPSRIIPLNLLQVPSCTTPHGEMLICYGCVMGRIPVTFLIASTETFYGLYVQKKNKRC